VVFVRDSMLQAVPFDLARMEATGEPLRVGDGVIMKETSGAADFAISANGTLVFLPGSPVSQSSSLVWVDRKGKRETLPAEPRRYGSIAVAPDGLKAAAIIDDETIAGLWILDLQRFTFARLTPPEMDVGSFPVWSPDSRAVAFGGATTDGSGGIYRVSASGTAAPELIRRAEGANTPNPTGWTPDGRAILFAGSFDGTGGVGMIDVATKRITPLFDTPATEGGARVSPDGKWVVYTSNETGRVEVFIRPFPNVNDEKIPVTAMGARAPMWRADGQELLVRSEGGPWSVPVSYSNGRIRLGQPARILELPALQRSVSLSATPDGSRFLLPIRGEHAEEHAEYRIVINWFEELNAKFARR
jgi:Tol biopolymer transport system component